MVLKKKTYLVDMVNYNLLIKIEMYEEICPKCEGKGVLIKATNNGAHSRCNVCNGLGKIDWIDKIKGSRKCSYCNGMGIDSVFEEPIEVNIRGNKLYFPGPSFSNPCSYCNGTGKVGYERK